MKLINFQKVGMENFSCYTDLMEYEFKNNKIILITGPNGSGKSTMIDDCLQFTLYGLTGKGAKSSDVINNIVGKNCHTFLDFQLVVDGHASSYHIDRYVKHSKFGDTVLLFQNDEEKPYKKGQREVLPEIEHLLMPQKLFTNTILFGQNVKDFFTDLPDSDRKEIFKKVLSTEIYEIYYAETDKELKEKKNELLEITKQIELVSKFIVDTIKRIKSTKDDIEQFEIDKTTEIDKLTQKINQLKGQLFELQEKNKSFEDFNDNSLNDIINEINTTNSNLQKLLNEKNNQVTEIRNNETTKKQELKSQCNELLQNNTYDKSTKINLIEKEYQEIKYDLTTKITEFQNQIIRLNNEIKTFENEILKNNQEIKKLEGSLNKEIASCPTCGKELTDENLKNSLINKLNTLVDRNNEIETITQNNNSSINTFQSELKSCQNKIDSVLLEQDTKTKEITFEFDGKKKDIETKLNEIILKVSQITEEKLKSIEVNFQSQISQLNLEIEERNKEKEKINEILQNKKLIETQRNSTSNEILLNEKLIEKVSTQNFNMSILDNYLQEKETYEKELIDYHKNKLDFEDDIEILTFWKSAFSSTGIPSLLIDESIPFLNKTVTKYLSLIGDRYQVSFDTISMTKGNEFREKINVHILDKKTKANNKKQLSGGQTRIIDIVILLSLADLQNQLQGIKSNILVLDEIFDALDDQNIEYVSSLIRTLAPSRSINIISHRHINSIEADEILKLF